MRRTPEAMSRLAVMAVNNATACYNRYLMCFSMIVVKRNGRVNCGEMGSHQFGKKPPPAGIF